MTKFTVIDPVECTCGFSPCKCPCEYCTPCDHVDTCVNCMGKVAEMVIRTIAEGAE